MKTIINPPKNEWDLLCKRPLIVEEELGSYVARIMQEVKEKGDAALFSFAEKFDGVKIDSLLVNTKELKTAEDQVSEDLKLAIQVAKSNIEKFHQHQYKAEDKIETMPGVVCWRKSVGIEKVGLYIPGGTAPLFSTVLMLAIPAMIAGCRDIVLCSPADKNGKINPVILYTTSLVGVNRIYKVGGAQAIAAMTYGTESIPQVYKIFGPGNQYVMQAKALAQGAGVAIDMPAGPSEVLIMADSSADVSFVTADLLSQAEHGSDSQVVLLANDKGLIEQVKMELEKQIQFLPRKEIAAQALRNSLAVYFDDLASCMDFSNYYAPEHLIISCTDASYWAEKVINAGSVFIGKYSCESAGDYASGTNHTLPTNGFAKKSGGVSVDSFVKKITFQEISKEGIQHIGSTIELMAEAEQLTAHKEAVSIRLKSIA